MSLIRHLRAALLFARHQAWVDRPDWTADDAGALTEFLGTRTGAKLRDYLINLALVQQSRALGSSSNLKFEAGYCTGQKATIAAITTLADLQQFTERGEDGADPATN